MALNRKASILFIICFGLFLTLSLAVGTVLAMAPESYTAELWASALLVSVPAFLIPALIFRRKNGFEKYRAPRATHILMALVLGIGCLFLNVALVCFTSALTYGIEIESNALDVMESLGGSDIVTMILCVAIIPAICEEFIMRGALLESWRRYSPFWAAFLTSLLFALLHLAPSNIIVYFAMGMLFAVVYNITRNVWLTVIIHFANNMLSVLQALNSLNAAETAEEIGEMPQADYVSYFYLTLLIAAAIIVPTLFILRSSCRKHGIGMYAPAKAPEALPEAYGEVSYEAAPEPDLGGKKALFSDPVLWISLIVLLALNVVFGLVEFGVIALPE